MPTIGGMLRKKDNISNADEADLMKAIEIIFRLVRSAVFSI
jgi:hypothetical protein